MTPDLIAAAARLADALDRENQALAALDLPRAAGLLADKQRAAEAFVAAQRLAAHPLSVSRHAAAQGVAGRLALLAEENRRLLERAIAVQERVIGTLARAVRPEPSGYGANGARNVCPRPDAIALAARA